MFFSHTHATEAPINPCHLHNGMLLTRNDWLLIPRRNRIHVLYLLEMQIKLYIFIVFGVNGTLSGAYVLCILKVPSS